MRADGYILCCTKYLAMLRLQASRKRTNASLLPISCGLQACAIAGCWLAMHGNAQSKRSSFANMAPLHKFAAQRLGGWTRQCGPVERCLSGEEYLGRY